MKNLILATTLAATVAANGGTNDIVSLPPVTVYASRIGDTIEDMPTMVRLFTADDIAASGARTLPELLDKAANLQLRTMNSNPLQAEISLRGYGAGAAGRVKLIVDGEELNSADMEVPNLMRIPVDTIERLEIIPGPSPVLYGDGAAAGVIHITTDCRDPSPRTRLSVSGGAYGTFDLNARIRGSIATNGLLYSASYGYRRSDGYRQQSGYDLHAVVAGLRQNFENGATFGIKANYFNARYQMPGALTYEQWKSDPRQAVAENDWCRLWSYGLGLDTKARLADDQWLYAEAVFSVKHRTSSWGDAGYANKYDLYSYQLSPRYVNEKSVFGLDNKVTGGIDFKYDRYEVRDRSGYDYPNSHFDRLRGGLYAQDELDLTEDLSLVAGARGELVDNRWTNCRALRETHRRDLTGDFELGLVYRPCDGLKTFIRGSRFHRSAAADEMNYTEDKRLLVPETGTSLDLGADWKLANEFHFDLSGHWTLTDDEIFYNPHARDYGGLWGGYNCNSPGRTERLGMDTGISWKRDKFAEASIRYTFVQSRFVSGAYAGKIVPLVPQNRVRAEIGLWVFDDLELKGGVRHVSSQFLAGDFENAHSRLPGYPLFDLGTDYKPSWARGWRLALTIDNLLDRHFCDYAGWSDVAGAYYYPACGRNFSISLSTEF